MYILLFTILFIVFCFGAVIGSFLNVVILRAFSGESIVMPPSKCPKCNNKLKWWHNIPILSYILLRGKCYFCHEKISIQYPIVEFITGILFVLAFIQYGIYPNVLFAFAVISILIVLSVTDIKEKVIFDGHAYALIAIGLIYNFLLTAIYIFNQVFNTFSGFHITKEWLMSDPLTSSILGLILGVVVMEIVARIGYLIAGQKAFGEGDSFIAAGLGAVFGWVNVILIIVLAVLMQAIVILPIFLKNQFKAKHFDTIISFAAVMLLLLIFKILDVKTEILSNFVVSIIAILIILTAAIIAIFNILKRIKSEEDNFTVLPFGPALSFAGLLLLLFNISIPLPLIFNWFRAYIGM